MEQENWNLFTWIFRGTVETIRISTATIITVSLICMRDKFVPFIAAYFVNGKNIGYEIGGGDQIMYWITLFYIIGAIVTIIAFPIYCILDPSIYTN